MKIAILTLPLHTNYGGILQAYALQTVLQRMGHEVTLLDQNPRLRNPWWHFPLSLTKRCLKKYIFGDKDTVLFFEHKLNRDLPVIRRDTDRFINGHFPNRIIYRNLEKEILPGLFDAIVVGSDQIWRPLYYPQISHAFLDFTQGWNIKRIAYAVSFGTDTWEYTPKQTEICKRLVQNFSGVSVREESAVDLCEKYLNVSAKWVLDPTMLLSLKDYLELCSDKDKVPQREGQILSYILDETEDKKKFVNIVSRQLSLTCFCTNNPSLNNINIPLQQRIVLPLGQWLKGFEQACFVVTDSFHACVFSILFHKPFFVYANKTRGLSRLKSLLSLLHLEDRLFYSSKVIESLDIGSLTSINWVEVDTILMKMKEKSMDFLKKNLNHYE